MWLQEMLCIWVIHSEREEGNSGRYQVSAGEEEQWLICIEALNLLHCLYGCEAPLASSVSHSCNKRPPEHVSRTQASSPTPPQLWLGRQSRGGSEGCMRSGKGGGFSGPWSFPRMYLTDCSLSMDWRVFFLIINLSNSRALAKANPG